MNQSSSPDIVQVFGYISSFIFGAAASEFLGPYLLIICSSMVGAGWSLGARQSQGKWCAIQYFVQVSLTAIFLTSFIAKILSIYVTGTESIWFYSPIALLIGMIGDRWKGLGGWFTDMVKHFADHKVGRK